MEILCQESSSYLTEDTQIAHNRKKIKYVVVINILTMGGEIVLGYVLGSMALVAEGWHMGSHAGALLITLLAYKLATSQRISQKFSFGSGKLIPLGGFTNAIILSMVALFILVESIERFFSPVTIQFNDALIVAFVGLVVNVASALILNHEHEDHHDHDHEGHHHHVHDHNVRSAFVHILADAVTSLLAIGGPSYR